MTLNEYREKNTIQEKRANDESLRIWENFSEFQGRIESGEHYEDQNDRRVGAIDG